MSEVPSPNPPWTWFSSLYSHTHPHLSTVNELKTISWSMEPFRIRFIIRAASPCCPRPLNLEPWLCVKPLCPLCSEPAALNTFCQDSKPLCTKVNTLGGISKCWSAWRWQMRVNKPKSIVYTGAGEWSWTSCMTRALKNKQDRGVWRAVEQYGPKPAAWGCYSVGLRGRTWQEGRL